MTRPSCSIRELLRQLYPSAFPYRPGRIFIFLSRSARVHGLFCGQGLHGTGRDARNLSDEGRCPMAGTRQAIGINIPGSETHQVTTQHRTQWHFR
ncbi:hypothetical protein BHM03_00057149 [Ensete ventricosum]|nr:hypothetical protein BHM03_00057149 [Ensete ventricosum]